MKKYFLLFAIACYCSHAQIPNSGFENWINLGPNQDPTGWTSNNGLAPPIPPFPCLKGSPGYTGSYFVTVITQTYMPSGSMAGFVITGQPIVPPGSQFRGFPLSNRPLTIDGFCKYQAPSANSNCRITVYMSKWNSGINKRDTVCYLTSFFSGTVTTWNPFSINLQSGYKSLANPDSCIISMYSNINTSSVGDYLSVDDISFNGTATYLSTYSLLQLSASYPNPSAGTLHLNLFVKEAKNLSISIEDVTGKQLLQQNLTVVGGYSANQLNLQDYVNGIYFLKIADSNGNIIKVERVVLNR